MIKATSESLLFGFKEIATWHIMKYALPIGLVVMATWIGLGLLFWESLSALSRTLIGFLPLNLMLLDGTWMMSTFIWLVLVILTYALVYIFFGNVIFNKISKDKYATFSLILMSLSAFFWLIVWYINNAYLHQKITAFLKTLPYTTVEHGLAYLFTIYIIYNAIVISMLFLVNIFNKPLIKHFAYKHYDGSLEEHHTLTSFRYTLKDSLLFIGISLLAFPLLFIPVVNFMVQIFLWVWLTKDTLQYNTASLVFKEVELKELKKHQKDIWFIGFVSVLFNFIPIFNIFAPFFGELSMFHYWKQIQQEG